MEIFKKRGETIVKSSAQSFLTNLVDYAGLFPPSQLPLTQAVENYRNYQLDNDAWMLGRFIIPAKRLVELSPYTCLFSEQMPLSISAIGERSTDFNSGIKVLQSDVETITAFCNEHGKKVIVDVIEIPLPPMLPTYQFLKEIGELTNNLHAFCEMTLPLNEQWCDQLLKTLDEISSYNSKSKTKFGMKLRTGGVSAVAFPTPIQVATALVGCYERNIPMKFTAGLHHPIRMYRGEVEAKMHGFINLFTAGMLVQTHRLDIKTTAEVLSDEYPSSFHFTEKGLFWNKYFVSNVQIKEIRNESLCSYGSCSFHEPREGLQLHNFI